MALKEELREKLPEEILLTPEYSILSGMIKKEKISSIAGLKRYIEREIRKTDESLRQKKRMQRGGTMTRWLRRDAARLDFLKLIKKRVLRYL